MANPPFSLFAVFSDKTRHLLGNTAAVVLHAGPLSDGVMQTLAANLNQPATTFLWPAEQESHYHVRWFAPDAEIGLCGHGAMAAIAFLSQMARNNGSCSLLYPEGKITGQRESGNTCSITLESIPVIEAEPVPDLLPKALGLPVLAVFRTANKSIVLVEKQEDVKRMQPDYPLLRQLPTFGYAVTAPGVEVDFVSRTLVPHVGQLEDPATGSSHAALAPFWAERLHKNHLEALQLSPRGGRFRCEISGNQVVLNGQFELIASGHLNLPEKPEQGH